MGFIWSQFFVTPSYPKESFSGQTVIVTGSNVGLGLEAARHIVRLDAKKVILAVRNTKAGEEAKQSIEASTKRPGVCEVWHLDLSSYASVKAFATKATNELDRLDVLLENAAIATDQYNVKEGHEATITVNVISTFLLGLLLLPKLQSTAEKHKTRPRLTFVTSEVHAWAKFPERDSANMLAALDDQTNTDMSDRYQVSKLLEVLVIREIAPKIAQGKYKDVIVNMLNPGLCHSSLARDLGWGLAVMKFVMARSTEVGSRTLVLSALAGPESHGTYMNDGVVDDSFVAPWVREEEGRMVGQKLWKEVKAQLEAIAPSVTKDIA